MPRKDFTQVALDVVRRATRQDDQPAPPAKAEKQTAPKAKTKGAAKKTGKKLG
jgi:hypothetical protein